jgi:hypothetical protein
VLQPRQVEQPARRRRGYLALDIACDFSGLDNQVGPFMPRRRLSMISRGG